MVETRRARFRVCATCERGRDGCEITGYEPFDMHVPMHWAMLGVRDQGQGEMESP
jgi:hypothetical protein